MTPADLEWFGDRVVANVLRAAGTATTSTADDAVDQAKADTPVLTGAAREHLERVGDGLDVAIGYVDLTDEQGHDRGLYIEVGANGKPGHYALRRAGDTHFPRLAGRIKRELG